MFALQRTARNAIAAGAISEAEASAWLRDLEEADARERFTFRLTFFEAFGYVAG